MLAVFLADPEGLQGVVAIATDGVARFAPVKQIGQMPAPKRCPVRQTAESAFWPAPSVKDRYLPRQTSQRPQGDAFSSK